MNEVLQAARTNGFPAPIFIHRASVEAADEFFAARAADARAIADPDGSLFRAFDLRRGSLLQLLGPAVWWRAWRALLMGNFVGRPTGNETQMPGAFLVRGREILWQHRARHAGDHPDLGTVRRTLDATAALDSTLEPHAAAEKQGTSKQASPLRIASFSSKCATPSPAGPPGLRRDAGAWPTTRTSDRRARGTASVNAESPRWARRWLAAAAIYNLAWGAFIVLFPAALFEWSDMELPRYPSIWQCVGMIVGVYGVGYAVAARDPLRHWPIVLVGLLGKVLGPIGFLQAATTGELPWRFGWTILTNDLIWWPAFGVILWRVWRQR